MAGPPQLMRIAVVSSHYPPDFVSGATLVAQRLARGFAKRGHDVGVFAGWLGLGEAEAREPLATWDELDAEGLRVRWCNVGPYIGWDDVHNFDNPEAVTAFAEWLDAFGPDVVHLHALQALGAGVLEAAADHGARVVVTMHDFWWICARQFLVDRQGRPCCLVIDAGTCACQVDRPWLAARNAWLRRAVARADLVLAPSRIATEVLLANGVAVGRLAADENGLPGAKDVGTRHRLGSGPVTFRYGGGWNPMKGAGELVDAAWLLHEQVPEGWRLVAHGLTQPGQPDPEVPSAVQIAPAYAPDDLDVVLASTDVLVLPSVMRETHSILTREALSRGVPVLTTDSLGPEEVVVDGVNGVVVPAADAASLAAAMARLVTDRQHLAALTAGTEVAVAIRSLDEQVDGLLGRFQELVAAPPPAPGAEWPRRVVWVVGIDGAPLRYRARLPAEALELLGIDVDVRHYRDPDVPRLVAAADVLVVYRVPATRQVLDLIVDARGSGTPVVFDVDDLIFDEAIAEEIPALRLLPEEERSLWLQGVRRYRRTMEACDGYIGSTQMLVDHAREHVRMPAARFDNGVGLALGRASDEALQRSRRPGPPRIGYLSGTTTHDEDWFFVEPAVAAVLEARPSVELVLGGHLPASELEARFPGRVQRVPFLGWTELPDVLRDLDVNLAPLAPGSRFNEAKSAIKWLEAALTSTPTVASPTGPFSDAITDGVNGFLAGTTGEWAAAILALIDDPLLRHRVGVRARRDALVRWSPHRQGQRYLALLREARGWAALPRTRPTGSVEFDEPPDAGVALEPYDTGGPALVATVVAATAPVPRPLARLQASVARDGLAATARKVVAKARHRLGS